MNIFWKKKRRTSSDGISDVFKEEGFKSEIDGADSGLMLRDILEMSNVPSYKSCIKWVVWLSSWNKLKRINNEICEVVDDSSSINESTIVLACVIVFSKLLINFSKELGEREN